jgi:hypothetical protein
MAFTADTAYGIIIPCCILGLIYALFNYFLINKINILTSQSSDRHLLDDKQKNEMIAQIGEYIQEVTIQLFLGGQRIPVPRIPLPGDVHDRFRSDNLRGRRHRRFRIKRRIQVPTLHHCGLRFGGCHFHSVRLLRHANRHFHKHKGRIYGSEQFGRGF